MNFKMKMNFVWNGKLLNMVQNMVEVIVFSKLISEITTRLSHTCGDGKGDTLLNVMGKSLGWDKCQICSKKTVT